MSKFKVGDKVVVVDSQSVGNYYKNGDKGIVSSVEHKLHGYVTRDDGVEMNVYWTEIDFEKETEMALTSTMNAEQIRDEILRIDVRIEEAKKDIENAEKERNSLVEKLREKGFEIVKPPSFKGRLNVGDKVKVIDNTTNHQFPIGAEVRIKFVYDNYYDCVNLEGVQWCCYDRDVEKI